VLWISGGGAVFLGVYEKGRKVLDLRGEEKRALEEGKRD
jgi:hypothetical protein